MKIKRTKIVKFRFACFHLHNKQVVQEPQQTPILLLSLNFLLDKWRVESLCKTKELSSVEAERGLNFNPQPKHVKMQLIYV